MCGITVSIRVVVLNNEITVRHTHGVVKLLTCNFYSYRESPPTAVHWQWVASVGPVLAAPDCVYKGPFSLTLC